MCCKITQGVAKKGCSQGGASSAAFHSEVTWRGSGEAAGIRALPAAAPGRSWYLLFRSWVLEKVLTHWSQVLEKPCVLLALGPAEATCTARAWASQTQQSCKGQHRGIETGREPPSSFSVSLLPLLSKLNNVPAGKREIITRPNFFIADQALRGEFGSKRQWICGLHTGKTLMPH